MRNLSWQLSLLHISSQSGGWNGKVGMARGGSFLYQNKARGEDHQTGDYATVGPCVGVHTTKNAIAFTDLLSLLAANAHA